MILGVYGTWGALGGCKIFTQGVVIICPLAETFFDKSAKAVQKLECSSQYQATSLPLVQSTHF